MAAELPPNSSSSLALKEAGNAMFKAGQYEEAIATYSRALEEEPHDATLLSNRAAAHLKLGDASAALADVDAAVAAQTDWEKGHFRRGYALKLQGELAQALDALNHALSLNPGNKELSGRVRQLRQKLRQAGRPAAGPRIYKMPEGGPQVPGPASWAEGLSQAQRYEWLTGCYRMRVDDDYTWGGGNLHGLYAPDATSETVIEDFWVFCKLAVRHGVVPQPWSWAAFLKAAAGLLPYAFEKSGAKEKWGGESVFSTLFGGRSLRATGEEVMGYSCMAMGAGSEGAIEAHWQLHEQVAGRLRALLGEGGRSGGAEGLALFADVGGREIWRVLLLALRLPATNWG